MNDHPCWVCGSHVAPFGYGPMGVRSSEEPHKFIWYCGEHRPEGKVEKLTPKIESKPAFECPF